MQFSAYGEYYENIGLKFNWIKAKIALFISFIKTTFELIAFIPGNS